MAKIIRRRFFSGAVCEQVVYTVQSDAHIDKEKLRFKSEAEREDHRREIGSRMVENFAETTINPHERKIDTILAAKQNRKPIYATLPRRNGKRFIYQLNQGKGW